MASRMLLSGTGEEVEGVTEEERKRKIELLQAQNQAAIEKADAFLRWFDRERPIREAGTERAFRELREAIRRR
jgi:hypothetical protein